MKRGSPEFCNHLSEIAKERYRGKVNVPEHTCPLVRELFEHINEVGLVPIEVEQKSGIGKHVLSEWRRRRNPSLINFIAVANSIGYDLKLVKREPEKKGE